MPQRRVPRLPSLVGSLGAALAFVVALALVPGASPTAQAQDDGPMMGPRMGPGIGPGLGPIFGPRGGGGAGYGDPGEIVVPGQTQVCRESAGAVANAQAFYSPTVGGFPVGLSGYSLPPYGGLWAMYTGLGNVCMWLPQ
jgi:hypothetical protein